jgi:hypothetical protein
MHKVKKRLECRNNYHLIHLGVSGLLAVEQVASDAIKCSQRVRPIERNLLPCLSMKFPALRLKTSGTVRQVVLDKTRSLGMAEVLGVPWANTLLSEIAHFEDRPE